MKVSSKLQAITPTELFKKQVSSTMEYARSEATNTVSIPTQFGGLFGQRSVLVEDIVMTMLSIDGRDT